MMNFKPNKKILSFLLLVILTVSVATVPVRAEDTEITESSTYVLDRDGNGELLYLYQSPCLIGYDLDNKYGGLGIPIQAFVFTMYNTETSKHIPAYCTDINVTARQGADYRRLNLEDSPFSGSSAGRIRAILQNGFYIIPISGETDADHKVRVDTKVAQMAKAAGVENLTVGEAIAATQCAIWQVAHGPILSFPKFCRSILNSISNTKYASLCSRDELKYKNNDLINARIKTVYDYLLSLKPVAASQKTVSPASFVKLKDPVLRPNNDNTYNVSVTTTVDVDMVSGDSLTLEARLNESYHAETKLANGKQDVTLTIRNVPADLASGEVTLSISGYQTATGYFYFDAEGDRTVSQAMVGYDSSRLPVYAEVIAADNKILNIYKTTRLETSNDSYVYKPLSNIIFDIYPVATLEEYVSGSVSLPDATEYNHSDLAEYTLITDDNGKASLNFLHHGLSDGVYLIVERNHPSIVKPIDPFYLYLPTRDPETSDLVYEITIRPKNDVKGGVKIEKDVISLGNNESIVNAYEPHTWIIGTTIPEDISTGKSYVITDTLDNRLDFVGNVKVNLENKDENADPVELTMGTDYELIVTDEDSLSEDKPSDSFRIEFTGTGLSKIAAAIGQNSFDNYMLRAYFDAQINANAEMGTQIPNQAQLKYVNAANVEFNMKSDIPHVVTGGIHLLKVDAANKEKTLEGAVFEVYRTASEEELDAADERLTEISGVDGKVIQVSFLDNSEPDGDKVTTATTDKDGIAAIYGLSYGTYYLLEVKAPAGYNSLHEASVLTIDGSSHTAEKIVTIENKSGVVLPMTGGTGTTIYTVCGIFLMCFAGLFLSMNKRRSIKS